MTCAEFESRLSAYMDGELSRWKRWKVQNHLHHCTECREMLEDLQMVDECLVSHITAAPTPDYVTAAVIRRLPAMPPAWRRHGSVLPWAAGLAVAGIQAAALCGAYWWGFHRGTVNGVPDHASVLSGPSLIHSNTVRSDSDSNSPGVWADHNPSTQSAVFLPSSPLSNLPRLPMANRPTFRIAPGSQPVLVHGGN